MSPPVTFFSLFVAAALLLVVATTPGIGADEHAEQDNQQAAAQNQPLPLNFLDHTEKDHNVVPVNRHQVVSLLIGNLKNGNGFQVDDCEKDEAVEQLKNAASKTLNSSSKANRLVRAVTEKLNVTCDEIKQIAGQMLKAESHEHAEKFRRDVEDIAVSASENRPFAQQVQGIPPQFLLGRGRAPPLGGRFGNFPGPPGQLRFDGSGPGENPFFSVPLTAPAMDMDLDRLMFICTPSLGINRSFELARILHVLGSSRSEVFQLQEKFQKNVTDTEANEIMQEYETKLDENKKNTGTLAPANKILQNTAELSGLNGTESHRFARAIAQTLGPLNSTQALQIHNAIRDHGLNKTEIRSLTNDIENLNAGTTTPVSATGHDWIFSGNASDGKRDVGLQSRVKMFSAERACGFAIESERGPLFPWMATLICSKVQCTGTLVSSTLVVTSASCILACGTDAVRVILGDNRLNGCGQKVVEVMAASAIVNPTFKENQNPQSDVGLVQLHTAIDFNLTPFIYPICLVGVETDDPTIECQAVMVGNQPPVIQNSVVNCYQPGNQLCATIGIPGIGGCVRLHNCFPIATQTSVPVICRRTQSNRYYLWGVTASGHASNTCTSAVTRISDCFSFITQGLGF